MQMVMAYAAVANGGFLMRPYVVSRVMSPNGDVLVQNQPHVVRRVISEKTSHLLASMLKEVTSEGGTGTMANIEGFDVAGKTGTAQVALKNGLGYAKGTYIASFIGYLPAEDPQVLIEVKLDEPRNAIYGGTVAAPTFSALGSFTVEHLKIPPTTAQSAITSATPSATESTTPPARKKSGSASNAKKKN